MGAFTCTALTYAIPCARDQSNKSVTQTIKFDASKKGGVDFEESSKNRPLGHKDTVQVEIFHTNTLKYSYDIKFEQQTIDNGIAAAADIIKKLTGIFATHPVSAFASVSEQAESRPENPLTPPQDPERTFTPQTDKEIFVKIREKMDALTHYADLANAADKLADAIYIRDSTSQTFAKFNNNTVDEFEEALKSNIGKAKDNHAIRQNVQSLLDEHVSKKDPTNKYAALLSNKKLAVVERSDIANYIANLRANEVAVQQAANSIFTAILIDRFKYGPTAMPKTASYDELLGAAIREVIADKKNFTSLSVADEALLKNETIPKIITRLPSDLKNKDDLQKKVSDLLTRMKSVADQRLQEVAALKDSYDALDSVVADLTDSDKFRDTVKSDILTLEKTNADRLRITVTIKPAPDFTLPTSVKLTVPNFAPTVPGAGSVQDSTQHQLSVALDTLNKIAAAKEATPTASDNKSADSPPIVKSMTTDVYGRWVPDFSIGGYFSDLRDRQYKAVPVSGTSGYTVDFDRYGNRVQGAVSLFHVYQTRQGIRLLRRWQLPITPAFTLGTDPSNFRSFLGGISAMIPFDQRRTRLFLTFGGVLGKVNVLDGVERGQRVDSTSIPTRQDFRAAGAVALSLIFNL